MNYYKSPWIEEFSRNEGISSSCLAFAESSLSFLSNGLLY